MNHAIYVHFVKFMASVNYLSQTLYHTQCHNPIVTWTCTTENVQIL